MNPKCFSIAEYRINDKQDKYDFYGSLSLVLGVCMKYHRYYKEKLFFVISVIVFEDFRGWLAGFVGFDFHVFPF
jgi:hypothetical protein